jgi:hypothetical protein
MEMVYIVNGNESGGGGGGSGGGGGASAGYPLVKAVVTDGAVGLQDRSVTRVELKTADAVRVNFPPKNEGVARDFILRLVITADSVPEVTFAVPTGETFSFEEGDEETFHCVVGVNVFAFTETDDGLFVVHRKAVSIAQEITFDANGGEVEIPKKDYLLGAKYVSLPVPTRRGYTFVRWATEDGVEVVATDTVKTSVTRLVAQWEVYVDKFAPAILENGEVVFTTDGNAKWTLDDSVGNPDVPSARSGAIGDSQSTSLFGTVTGPGVLAFRRKVSSESGWDHLRFFADGVQKFEWSGEQDWGDVTCNFTEFGPGEHVFEWRYVKDGSVSRGSDCAWIDRVQWRAV